MSEFTRIDEVMLWVQDLDRSIAFYEQTLGILVADVWLAFFRDPDGNHLQLMQG